MFSASLYAAPDGRFGRASLDIPRRDGNAVDMQNANERQEAANEWQEASDWAWESIQADHPGYDPNEDNGMLYADYIDRELAWMTEQKWIKDCLKVGHAILKCLNQGETNQGETNQ